jgi:endo-1,4-beta-xylanase
MANHSARAALLIRIPVLLFLLSSAVLQAASQTPSNATSPAEIQTDIPSLQDLFSRYFPIGAAIRPADLAGPHSELLKKHFNSITAENAMKWSSLEREEGQLNFAPADSLVAFARGNGVRVRGHNLVWHEQVPAWVFKDEHGVELTPTPEAKALLLRRLEKHVREVVLHFRGDIYAWDVVNEPIDPTQPDGFRRSLWFRITGTAYIDTAFRVAHEVDPQAKLYLNEYDTTDPLKRSFLLKLARDMRNRGVPIDGVGHQMHSNVVNPSPRAIRDTVKMFAKLGLDNQITELDMSLYSDPQTRELTDEQQLLIEQGYRYRDFFHELRKLQGKISSVTFWGIADDHTWLTNHPIPRRDLPLLFDRQLQAKYAYWGIVDPSKLPKRPHRAKPHSH